MRSWVFIFCVSLCSAQIQDLATTGDGGQTYFATAYRMKGSNQPGHLKLFRIAENGLELFREIEQSWLVYGIDTNFYLAERPSVSFDGRVVAYTAARNCYGGSHCVGFSYYQGWLARAGAPDANPSSGMLAVSSNGRFLLSYNRDGMPFLRPPVVRYDLTTGAVSQLVGYWIAGDGRQAIADDGTVLAVDSNGAALWNGVVRRLSLAAAPVTANLDAAASTVVYESASGSSCELHAYDVASGRDRLLAAASSDIAGAGSCFHPVLTRYGESVIYLLGRQLYIQARTGLTPRKLTSAAEGVTDATISGRGNVAYAATSTGRLLRIDVATSEQTEVIGAPPHLDVDVERSAFAPGGRVIVDAANSPSDPSLLTGAGAAPIIARTPTGVVFQIPWQASDQSDAKIAAPDNPSPLEEVHDVRINAADPKFYTLPAPENEYPKLVLAAHEDFSALVDDQNPARPGEIVHLYATGLGAVTPSLETGASAGAERLYYAVQPFSCDLRQGIQSTSSEILFAGLAPGFVGVNQIDVRIPPGFSAGRVMLDCKSSLPVGTISAFAAIPIAP
jgi:uncharacterized protein (TIGR03437 family)